MKFRIESSFTPSRWAISRFYMPSTTRRTTSSSRRVNNFESEFRECTLYGTEIQLRHSCDLIIRCFHIQILCAVGQKSPCSSRGPIKVYFVPPINVTVYVRSIGRRFANFVFLLGAYVDRTPIDVEGV